MPSAGDFIPYEGRMCRVLAVTYREGGICTLRRPDGTIVENVRPEDRLRPRPVLKEISA